MRQSITRKISCCYEYALFSKHKLEVKIYVFDKCIWNISSKCWFVLINSWVSNKSRFQDFQSTFLILLVNCHKSKNWKEKEWIHFNFGVRKQCWAEITGFASTSGRWGFEKSYGGRWREDSRIRRQAVLTLSPIPTYSEPSFSGPLRIQKSWASSSSVQKVGP